MMAGAHQNVVVLLQRLRTGGNLEQHMLAENVTHCVGRSCCTGRQ